MKRLSQIMSERGICSRREAEFFINKGWLVVNGETILKQGVKFSSQCSITLHRKAQNFLIEQKTFLLYKPKGYVSSQAEKGFLPAISLIRKNNQDPLFSEKKFEKKYLKGLACAGRLDYDSQGLLVMTQKGSLVKKIIGPRSDMEKEYELTVKGKITEEKIKKLRYGLSLDGKKLKKTKVTQIKKEILHLILKEGRKRQIRRMCRLVELKVMDLKRVRIGKIKLGSLKLGCWRYLNEKEEF